MKKYKEIVCIAFILLVLNSLCNAQVIEIEDVLTSVDHPHPSLYIICGNSKYKETVMNSSIFCQRTTVSLKTFALLDNYIKKNSAFIGVKDPNNYYSVGEEKNGVYKLYAVFTREETLTYFEQLKKLLEHDNSINKLEVKSIIEWLNRMIYLIKNEIPSLPSKRTIFKKK